MRLSGILLCVGTMKIKLKLCSKSITFVVLYCGEFNVLAFLVTILFYKIS